eukprot:s1767_g7.t1
MDTDNALITFNIDDSNDIDDSLDAFDSIDADEYDIEETTGMPTIKLHYPEDYDTVRNLPAKRMRKTAKKRVRSWAKKTLLCLVTTLTAFAAPVASFAEEVVMEPARDFVNAVMGPTGITDDRADFLELFAGSAHLTERFVYRGYSVLQPRDILMGHDLFDPLQQGEVMRDIGESRPRLLWVALPCTKWSPWQRLNYAHRKQELRRARQKQRKLVKFAVDCAWKQLENGGEVAFEHPRESDLWEDDSMRTLLEASFMMGTDIDMCRYNLRAITDGGRLRKPTRILASNHVLLDRLRLQCHGGHEHTPTEGRNTRHAGIYTKEFCQAVVEGFAKYRGNMWNYTGDDYEGNTWHAYAAANYKEEKGVKSEPGEEGKVNTTGIHFPEHVPHTLAKALRRVHQNLGHPSNADLARHLKLSGANEEAVKAAHSLHCETCARHANPGTRRPAKVFKPLEFNQEVSVDTLNLQDAGGNKIEVMSILDHATGYHVVTRLSGRKSGDLATDFNNAWSVWAGFPIRMTCDQERGFMNEFADYMEMGGTQVRYTAGQAHWQHGVIERQNFWYRNIWDKVIAHIQPTEEEINYVLSVVAAAKNNLRRRHGYSPAQWLFGASPRLGDAMVDESAKHYQLEELRSPDEQWRRRQSIRQAAREAFIQSQADESLKRAVLGRPRTTEDFEVGDYVYTGWTRRLVEKGGGRCILCAGEHLRQAESEELGSAFQTKALKEDLMKLVDNMENLDDDEIFADATDQITSNKRPLPGHALYHPGEAMPEKRLNMKGTARMHKRPASPAGEAQAARPSPGEARGSDDPEPDQIFDDPEPDRVFVVEKRIPRSIIKHNDKELKWRDIPDDEKALYNEAEDKQWREHMQYEAVRVHPPEDAELLRRKVPKERILKARFAYRDKNVAKRREDPTIPCKAKARLCVGGHLDPDLRTGHIKTEAPTASKTALHAVLFLAAHFGWRLAAGDVEAAFVNGIESRRGLYFEPPRQGLPGVADGSLIEIVKGIFGLSNSPRLWWQKLASELRNMEIKVGEEILKLQHHDYDPCLLLLRNMGGELKGTLMCHVDDLLIAAGPEELHALQTSLSGMFPISTWETDHFEYTGSVIKQTDSYIEVNQISYVNARLETVDIPKNVMADDEADQVTKQDNMSTIGALSWLSSQTKPDLQAGVSLAQRKQKNPKYQDAKETNRLVKMAQSAKDEPIRYTKLTENLNDLVMLIFHDAAWANAPADSTTDDPEFVNETQGHGIYSQLGHILVMADRRALRGLEGWEEGIAFRSFLAAALSPDRGAGQEHTARALFPMVSLTDCKSVYDNVHRTGGPKAPTEKRLVVDIVALRKMVYDEAEFWGNDLPDGKTLRWLPTNHQLADVLTKVVVDVKSWWAHASGVPWKPSPVSVQPLQQQLQQQQMQMMQMQQQLDQIQQTLPRGSQPLAQAPWRPAVIGASGSSSSRSPVPMHAEDMGSTRGAPHKKAVLQPQTPDKPFYNEHGVDLMKLSDSELEKVVPLNANGERTSIGALQHPDKCSRCIFWFRNICEKGIRCEFCHFAHPGQIAKKIRPSKSVRLKQKDIVLQDITGAREERGRLTV